MIRLVRQTDPMEKSMGSNAKPAADEVADSMSYDPETGTAPLRYALRALASEPDFLAAPHQVIARLRPRVSPATRSRCRAQNFRHLYQVAFREHLLSCHAGDSAAAATFRQRESRVECMRRNNAIRRFYK
jgi:hypothetical protein